MGGNEQLQLPGLAEFPIKLIMNHSITSEHTLLCETTEMRDWLSVLYPKTPCLAAQDLLGELVGWKQSHPRTRLRLFENFGIPEPYPLKKVLATVEALRTSLVLRHDDIDFCFSAIANTPKNHLLRKVCHAYLDSELSQDETLAYWSVIEQLKSLKLKNTLTPAVIFVKSVRSTYLFSELASSFRYAQGIDSSHLVELWNLGNEEAKNPCATKVGSRARCLTELFLTTENCVKKGVSLDKIHIGFQGKSHELKQLMYFLDHKHLPYRLFIRQSGLAETSNPGISEYELLHRLRQSHSICLIERLKLGHLLLEESKYRKGDFLWPEYLRRLERKGKLSEPDRVRLETLLTNPPTPTEFEINYRPEQAAIAITPFQPPPQVCGLHSVSYVSKVSDPLEADLLLELFELRALRAAGFDIPLPSSEKLRLSEMKNAYLQSGLSTKVFLTDDMEGVRNAQPLSMIWKSIRLHRKTNILAIPTTVLSATQLETFAQCGAKYFYSHRIKISRRRTFALHLGTLTHLALERYLKASAAPPLLELYESILGEVFPTLDKNHPTYTMLVASFRPMARRFESLERQIEKLFGPCETISLEDKFSVNIDSFSFTGKMDRVIRTLEGHLIVLDYKTGNVDFSPPQVERGENFQAPLYLLGAESLFGKRASAVLFYDLKKGELRRGLVEGSLVDSKNTREFTRGHVLTTERFESVRSLGTTAIVREANEISRGNFSAAPSTEICRHCDFGTLCRESLRYV